MSFPVKVLIPNMSVSAELLPGKSLLTVDKPATYNLDEALSTIGPVKDIKLDGIDESKAKLLGRIRLEEQLKVGENVTYQFV